MEGKGLRVWRGRGGEKEKKKRKKKSERAGLCVLCSLKKYLLL